MPSIITDEYINLRYNGKEKYALCVIRQKLFPTKIMNFHKRMTFSYWICKDCDG